MRDSYNSNSGDNLNNWLLYEISKIAITHGDCLQIKKLAYFNKNISRMKQDKKAVENCH